MPKDTEIAEQQQLETLLNTNLELTKENHELLRKMKRNSTIALVLQISWYAVLVGVPVILYWFLLEPIVSSDSAVVDFFSDTYDTQE